MLFADIGEHDRQLVADLVAYHCRDADRAGLGEPLQAGGDVDPVAKEVGAVDHNVADVDADAEAHRLARDTAGVLGRDRILHRHRARDRVDRAGEIGDHAVTGSVEDPAAMGCDQPVDDDPTGFEPGKGADFVVRHQPAVAGNVGREDRRELSFNRLCRHARLLPRASIANHPVPAEQMMSLPITAQRTVGHAWR